MRLSLRHFIGLLKCVIYLASVHVNDVSMSLNSHVAMMQWKIVKMRSEEGMDLKKNTEYKW